MCPSLNDRLPLILARPVLTEFFGAHVDVTQDASQRTDFQRLIPVDGNGRVLVPAGEIMMTAANAEHGEAVPL